MYPSPLWVFSLNHDLLFEMICTATQIPMKFGMNGKKEIYGVNFETLSKEEMNSNRFSFFTKEKRTVNLVKMHGALDLFTEGNNRDYLKIVNSNSPSATFKDLKHIVETDMATKNNKISFSPLITYFDNDGVDQFLMKTILSGKHKFTDKIQHDSGNWFFRIFEGYINHVKSLYVIGYSFGDEHINIRLCDWISFSASRKLIIVNPGIGEIPLQFRHLKDQCSIMKIGFRDFLHQNSSR